MDRRGEGGQTGGQCQTVDREGGGRSDWWTMSDCGQRGGEVRLMDNVRLFTVPSGQIWDTGQTVDREGERLD